MEKAHEGKIMDAIMYKEGHKIPKELIIQTLTNYGFTDIENNDYDNQGTRQHSYRYMPIFAQSVTFYPDFICKLGKDDVAVEVGIS